MAGKLSGDRSTSLRVVGLLIQIATTVDLSDNSLTDDEALALASSVRQATKMTKFVLQSLSLTDTGVRALQEALSACPADVATVDLPALKEVEEAAKEETAESDSMAWPDGAVSAQEEADALATQQAEEATAAEAAATAKAEAEAAAKAKAEADAQAAREAEAKAAADSTGPFTRTTDMARTA